MGLIAASILVAEHGYVTLFKHYGKERVALDYGRLVLYNKWTEWKGNFGRGGFVTKGS